MSKTDSTVVVFDWETTDKDPGVARGAQFAAIQIMPEGEHVLANQLCNPGGPIDPGATRVHGITDDMVADAEPDTDVASQFVSYVRNVPNVITAGQNTLSFDIPITNRLSGTEVLDLIPHIDTMVLAQRTYPRAPDHKLSTLVQWLELGDAEGAHDALVDVRMVGTLIEHFQVKLDMTPMQLAQWTRTPYVHEYCHFGKHKGKPWKDVPLFYVKWCTENWTDATPDMRATIKYHFNLEFKS